MLKELYIKDFAIIHEIRLEFGEGLNLITGETGAGKSLLIDALQALLGEKSWQENIREGARESVIEGKFSIPSSFPLREKYLDLNYIQADNQEIIIRRIITGSGKNRSYLNGNMVNLATLSELSDALIEVHGQNQQISLFKKSVQLSLLDSYAGLEETRASFEKLYNQWSHLSSTLEKLKSEEEEKKTKRTFLQFQVDELEAANLEPEEEVRLTALRDILSKSEYLKSRSEEAYQLLSEREENAVLTQLQMICRDLAEVSKVDPGAGPILELISSAQIQLKEGGALLRDYREKVEYQPDHLEKIEKRLFELSHLKKKYALSLSEIADKMIFLKKELNELNGLESDIQTLFTELSAIEKKMEVLGDDLSVKRREAIRDLEQSVIKELKGLKIDQPEFKVIFLPLNHPAKFSRYGKEGVSFLISMNPGFAPAGIEKVASGGELSRLMLVLKTVLSEPESVPVLIFDEIDSGVGGGVAEFIGRKLWKLSKNRQVFCITHLPQIASFGKFHFKISKKIKNGKSDVVVKMLDAQERIQEIGRMLGGSTITPKTLKLAEELMSSASDQ